MPVSPGYFSLVSTVYFVTNHMFQPLIISRSYEDSAPFQRTSSCAGIQLLVAVSLVSALLQRIGNIFDGHVVKWGTIAIFSFQRTGFPKYLDNV